MYIVYTMFKLNEEKEDDDIATEIDDLSTFDDPLIDYDVINDKPKEKRE